MTMLKILRQMNVNTVLTLCDRRMSWLWISRLHKGVVCYYTMWCRRLQPIWTLCIQKQYLPCDGIETASSYASSVQPCLYTDWVTLACLD